MHPGRPEHPEEVVNRVAMMARFPLRSALLLAIAPACVPPGNAPKEDAGASKQASNAPTFRPSANIMTAPFEDTFERTAKKGEPIPPAPVALALAKEGAIAEGGASGDAQSAAVSDDTTGIGSDWSAMTPGVWKLENGKLCGQNGKNHGIWLNRVLPVNARIEFDAVSDNPKGGDIKAEIWGDGHSGATGNSYTNATSYLTILGGWFNTFHVLARINEHAPDRKEIKVDAESDDAREHPAVRGQVYRFKIERTDGKTVRWFVNGVEYLKYEDAEPLRGLGHDHFGFNDWEAKICFDNVKVTPLP